MSNLLRQWFAQPWLLWLFAALPVLFVLAVVAKRGRRRALALLGALLVFASIVLLPETLPPSRRRAGSVRQTARVVKQLFRDRSFTGLVLGLQGMLMLQRVGSEAFVGPLVAIALVRELGPVLAALMVSGRAGSAIAAELGVMQITEQIDALTVMALNPMRYLTVPILVAGVVSMPLLAWIFDVVGIFGGYVVTVALFGLSEGTYFGQIRAFLSTTDLLVGFWKAIVFGVIVMWVAAYKGFHVGHGAEGVGRATTEAVVLASVLILVFDYFLGSVLP